MQMSDVYAIVIEVNEEYLDKIFGEDPCGSRAPVVHYTPGSEDADLSGTISLQESPGSERAIPLWWGNEKHRRGFSECRHVCPRAMIRAEPDDPATMLSWAYAFQRHNLGKVHIFSEALEEI
jgi:hypothetical protein